MKAITFAAPIPTYLATLAAGRVSSELYVGPHACTRYRSIAAPELPGDRWVRIRTSMGGICGSDLSIVSLEASPSTSPFSSFPFVLGHENVGVVAETGRAVRGVTRGERVVVNPLLCCEPRGVSPICGACAQGHHPRCAHFTDGPLAPGMLIGTTRGLGGSWGEEFVAHESQIVRVPDSVADTAALLVEPLACCVHAVRASLPAPGDRVLVIGAGTMGLLAVAALAALAPEARVTVLARHQFQATRAAQLGAAHTVLAREDYQERVAALVGARLLKPIIGPPIGVGGYDVVFLCIASPQGMGDAMRFARAGGTIVLLGNASTLRGVDWTPMWLKELTMRGTLAYGAHGHGGAGDAFADAAELIATGRAPVAPLVTHVFPLHEYRAALGAARSKGNAESVKVAFRF